MCIKVHISAKRCFKNLAWGGSGGGEWGVFVFD